MSVYRGIADGVTRVVDADPPGGERLRRRARNDVLCVGRPLLHLIHEGDGEIVMEGQADREG